MMPAAFVFVGSPRSLLLSSKGPFSPTIPNFVPGALPDPKSAGPPSLRLPRGGASTSRPLCFSWRHLKHALVSSHRPSWQPNGLIFTLVSDFNAASRGVRVLVRPPSPSHGRVSPSLPSHTLRPGHPTRRAWQPWLSQPCQRVRRQRFAQPRAGCSAHDWQLSHSFVRVNAQGSTSPASAFSAMPASTKRSTASRIASGLPGINGTPPLQVFNVDALMARHSEPARPSQRVPAREGVR